MPEYLSPEEINRQLGLAPAKASPSGTEEVKEAAEYLSREEIDRQLGLIPETKPSVVSPKAGVQTVNHVAKPGVDTAKIKNLEAQLNAAQKAARISKAALEKAEVQLTSKENQAGSLMAERDQAKAELVQVAATRNGAESRAKAAELELKRITTESDNARCPGCQALVDWAGLPIRKAPVRVWKDRRLDDEFTVLGSTTMVDYRRCPVCTYVEEVK